MKLDDSKWKSLDLERSGSKAQVLHCFDICLASGVVQPGSRDHM